RLTVASVAVARRLTHDHGYCHRSGLGCAGCGSWGIPDRQPFALVSRSVEEAQLATAGLGVRAGVVANFRPGCPVVVPGTAECSGPGQPLDGDRPVRDERPGEHSLEPAV